MSFGQKLREARENKGYSLEYIEEETKIRKLYINALEQENFKVLPPKVYATGFVRKYAKFLGLDSDAMVEDFQILAYTDELVTDEQEPQKKKVNIDFHIPYRNILAGIIFLLIAIWAGNLVLDYVAERVSNPDNQGSPAKVEEPAQVPDKNNYEGNKENTNSEEPKAALLIEARQDCWLNVVVDGESVYSRTMKPGESESFEGKQSIYIKAGNAGGIDITFNGKKQEPIGKSWEVKEKEFIVKSLQE